VVTNSPADFYLSASLGYVVAIFI